MPKNMGMGGKNRKRGTNKNEPQKRELTLAGEDQDYGQVTKMLGMGHLQITLQDGSQVTGVICGRMKKKVWISVGDVVLIALREFEQGKVDVIGKYNADEAKSLAKDGHFRVKEKEQETGKAGAVMFADESDNEEDDSEKGSDYDDLMVNPNQKGAGRQQAQAYDDDEDEEDEDVDIDDI